MMASPVCWSLVVLRTGTCRSCQPTWLQRSGKLAAGSAEAQTRQAWQERNCPELQTRLVLRPALLTLLREVPSGQWLLLIERSASCAPGPRLCTSSHCVMQKDFDSMAYHAWWTYTWHSGALHFMISQQLCSQCMFLWKCKGYC